MSAIAGLVYFDGRSDREGVISRMLDCIAHHGPDGRAEVTLGPASLGHLLLSASPESANDKLPRREGNLLISAATRLDYSEGLDSDVFLKNRDNFANLDGDFAAAIFDTSKNELLLARDHFGLKPLYYYHAPGRFIAFASEIRALFAHPEVPRRLNKKRLAQIWLGQSPDHAITIYEDIFRLPPAHTLLVSKTKFAFQRYWSLDPNRELSPASDAEYEEAFREQFTRAVQTRLRTPHKIAFQLSGGLDSSAVACVGRDLLRAENRLPAATYSDIFPTIPTADERPYIDSALAQGGFDPHFVEADQSSPLAELPPFLDYDDEGAFNTNANLVFLLHRRMRADGVRVCLDGFDGDTTIGHGRFLLAELANQQNWSAFDRELAAFRAAHKGFRSHRALSFAGPAVRQKLLDGNYASYFRTVRAAAPHFTLSPLKLFLETAVRPLLPIEEVSSAVKFLNRLIDPAIARSIDLHGNAREFTRDQTGHFTSERALQVHLLTGGSFSFALERFDCFAAHFQLENRHPFMDRRLIEFCLALPASQKLRGGLTRSILRRSLANSLPKKIADRARKTDFTEAFRKRFFEADRDTLDRWILHSNDLRGWLDMSALHDSYADALEGNLPDSHLFILFRVLTSAAWLRHTSLELR